MKIEIKKRKWITASGLKEIYIVKSEDGKYLQEFENETEAEAYIRSIIGRENGKLE